jgi:hypothetical protein
MGSHPVNLGFRFLLELAALGAFGYWGWQAREDWLRVVLAIGAPAVAAMVWGTFRVRDSVRHVPVAVPGGVRLVVELLYFGLAVAALAGAGATGAAWVLGAAVAVHYALSYDYVWRLVRGSPERAARGLVARSGPSGARFDEPGIPTWQPEIARMVRRRWPGRRGDSCQGYLSRQGANRPGEGWVDDHR